MLFVCFLQLLHQPLLISSRFAIPVVNAVGGQKITDVKLNEILLDMHRIFPKPQVHIVVLGSNNFRFLQDDPKVILNLVSDFMIEARKIRNCRTMFSSLVPSVKNKHNCDEIFLHEFF